jgi:hypothetical protein
MIAAGRTMVEKTAAQGVSNASDLEGSDGSHRGVASNDSVRLKCFDRPDERDAFQTALVGMFGQIQMSAMTKFVRPENIQRFAHGGALQHPAAPGESARSHHSYESPLESHFT